MGAFNALALVLFVGVGCMIIHDALANALHRRLGVDHPASEELFGSPAWAHMFNLPRRFIRAQFFWPFTPSPPALETSDRSVNLLFLAARLSGAGAVVGFAGFLAAAFILGIRNA